MATSRKTEKRSAAGTQPAANLPLFFSRPEPLQAERHREAGLSRLHDLSFAADTNSVALNVVEFFEAARCYPIVFTTAGAVLPVALLGIREKNCFLDGKGSWMPRAYIPAYVRRYPFIFMEDTEQDRLILCVDEQASHYEAKKPDQRFFADNGEMSEFSQQALQFCALYHQHHLHTVAFCEALKEHDLLVQKASAMRLADGNEISLSGFSMLDVERFQALPDDIYLAWRKKGWIAAVDAVLLSYTNWKYLAELVGNAK